MVNLLDPKLNGQKMGNNSKYLLSLEKNYYSNKLISTLEIDGNIVKNPTKISEALETFYQNLYSEKLNENSRSYKESLDKFLLDNDMPKLNVEQKEFCDKPSRDLK